MNRKTPKKKVKHHPVVMCPHCAGHTFTDYGGYGDAVNGIEHVGGCLQI